MLEAIKNVTGHAVPVVGDDIDTDRIIPARFLKCVTFEALGEQLFYDVRFDEKGNSLNHTIDAEKYKGANIILSGNNFGCGSSREHAPQAIIRAGFNVVIAESFAEIFFGNCITLGIVCAVMPKAEIAELVKMVEAKPDTDFNIDVEACTLTAGDKKFAIKLQDGQRNAFLANTYDSLSSLLKNADSVKELENKLPYRF